MNSKVVSNPRRGNSSRQDSVKMKNCNVNFELAEDSDDDKLRLPKVPIEMENCTFSISKPKKNQRRNPPMLEDVNPPQLMERTPRRMREIDLEFAPRRPVHSAPPRRMPSAYDEEVYSPPLPTRVIAQRRSKLDDDDDDTAVVGNSTRGMRALEGRMAGLVVAAAFIAVDDSDYDSDDY